MNRRAFLKRIVSGFVGMGGAVLLAACMAPLVSATARDRSAGAPWQCMNCGHLTRSTEDLSDTPCPRCTRRMLARITEEEMSKALAKLAG